MSATTKQPKSATDDGLDVTTINPKALAASKDATRRRWIDIALYASFGVFCLTCIEVEDWLKHLPLAFTNEYGAGIAGLVLLAWMHRHAGFHGAHLLVSNRFPSFVVSVAVALWIHVVWLHITSADNRSLWLLLTFVYCAVLATFGLQAQHRLRRPQPATDSADNPSSVVPLEAMDARQLREWLKREEPIESPQDALFGFGIRVERVLSQLLDPSRKTVAVVGPYGCGKSSLLKLLERAAALKEAQGTASQQLWFCTVTCWGFKDGKAAAEVILAQAVECISQRMDCLAIRSLPERYARALAGLWSVFDTLLTLSHGQDPEDQLKRLSPYLQAANARLVVMIEDADRNGRDFDVHEIEGLLARLRDVDGVSFVIATGPGTPMDFVRLCEHTEVLPSLPTKSVTAVVDLVRESESTRYGDIDTAMRPRFLTTTDSFSSLLISSFRDTTWSSQLSLLLNTPRLLKRALRRFTHAWETLHGEVDMDELLIASALRECAPKAFGFLLQRHRSLERLPPGKPSPELELLRSEWKSISEGDADKQITLKLMAAIFPSCFQLQEGLQPNTVGSLQGMRLSERPAYRERIFTEDRSQKTPLDQPFLKLLVRANSEAVGMRNLADALVASEDAWAQFTHFEQHFFQGADIRSLASEMFSAARDLDGTSPWQAPRGLIPICFRVAKQFQHDEPSYSDWVHEQVCSCLPGHVQIAVVIGHSLYPDSGDTRCAKTNQWLLEKLKPHFQAGGVDALLAALPVTSALSLAHVICSYSRDWKWIGSLLIDALKRKSEAMLHYVVPIVFKWSTSNGDLRSLEVRDRALNDLFGAQVAELMEFLAGIKLTTPTVLVDGVMFPLERLRAVARDWLGKATNEGLKVGEEKPEATDRRSAHRGRARTR